MPDIPEAIKVEEHIIERKQIVLERLHQVAKRSLLPS